ncbi:MAG TPA: hypothetical protein DEF48_18800 [Nostoc sp. UBA8866]|nr:hypothetical protein [Nostoc sp. UBA8866]
MTKLPNGKLTRFKEYPDCIVNKYTEIKSNFFWQLSFKTHKSSFLKHFTLFISDFTKIFLGQNFTQMSLLLSWN